MGLKAQAERESWDGTRVADPKGLASFFSRRGKDFLPGG
jgi:hypothetical protein